MSNPKNQIVKKVKPKCHFIYDVMFSNNFLDQKTFIKLKILFLFVLFFPVKTYSQQPSLRYEIRYKPNSYKLSDQNKATIHTILDSLQGKTNYIIYINGHTDSDADSSYNQQLSLKRSLEVKNLLVEEGIEDTLIKVQARGEEQPLVENSTPIEKAKNRRVELVVLFSKTPQDKFIEVKKYTQDPSCNGDTTVILKGGYVLTMSKCDWERNSRCLKVQKSLTYKFHVKENWLKRHIGFKHYTKRIRYEPHYEFRIVACWDSCFQNKIRLYIPEYNADGFNISANYSQKKNNKNRSSKLTFKKTKLGDSAYYVANIYCPGSIDCGTRLSCTHNIDLYAKNKISILSYSYILHSWHSDSTITVKPKNPKRLTDNYAHAFFYTLTILHKSDTIVLKNIPIEIFAHNQKRIIIDSSYNSYYFLFIPFRKKIKCEHYTKYKIRSRDIDWLKQFNLFDLEIYDEENPDILNAPKARSKYR